jgi:hypothetical protein
MAIIQAVLFDKVARSANRIGSLRKPVIFGERR